jgi:hypothetical protein
MVFVARMLIAWNFLMLSAAYAAPPAGEWLHQSREPLTDRRGNIAYEGRQIRVAADSYPRPPAKIVNGPTAERDGERVLIRFTLDRSDDVLVRIVDAQGKPVRTLVSGLLGPNAPEPLQPEALSQTIAWDGKDALGQPAPAGCRVQVSVGLTPRFERFVGYDPGQLLGEIVWLEVDPQGRVYVQVATGRKTDRTMLRFDRDGKYLDMAYPSNPDTLAKLGKSIEEVWPFVAHFDGQAAPHRPRSWPSFAPYSSDPSIPYPMRIAGDGTVYFAESTTGYPRWASAGEPFRLFTTHVDQFWFLEMTPLMWSMGPFAIDEQGYGYIATSTADRCTGTYPRTRDVLNDPAAPGTIRKVNLKTGELAADFEYNGTQRRETKSAYLGTTQTVAPTRRLPAKITNRESPDPADDSDHHFLDLFDLTIDREGNILVVDGWPRRVKIYAENGRFLGEVDGLDIGGQAQRFADLRGIAWEGEGFYLLGSFQGQTDKTFLAKCSGDLTAPAVRWITELDGQARHIAVDRAANPPLIWVGTGAGPATLTRIADLGDQAGDIRSVGGRRDGVFSYPWNMAADSHGNLYVHDHDRESLVRVSASGDWQEAPLRGAPISMLVDEHGGRLLVSYSLGENGNYTPGKLEEEAGFLAFDLNTLKRLPFRLESVYTPEELAQRDRSFQRRPDLYYPWAKTYGGTLTGVDAQGNIYVRDADRGQRWHKATPAPGKPHAGVIRKYTSDGAIADEAHCRLFFTGGGARMDSKGCFYAVELPLVPWGTVVHDFQAAIGHQAIGQVPLPRRGEEEIRTQSGLGHVVKIDAAGGARQTDAEQWAHRGVSGTNAGGCYCDWPDNHLAVDAADRIFAADIDLHLIRLLDTSGNMLARIGRWGNAETLPGNDGHARDVGFRLIYCLAAAQDTLYVSDKDLRRIAQVQMDYRETAEAPVP